MNAELEDYILSHIEPEPEYLYRLWRATNLHLLNGRMASGHLQGRLLKMLVEMIRPQNVLEVGTFSGYSAISMANGDFHQQTSAYTFTDKPTTVYEQLTRDKVIKNLLYLTF